MAKTMDRTPAWIEMRVPQIPPASPSRPRSSVPRRWTTEAGLRMALQSVWLGSRGASHGAPAARATKARTTAAPATAGGRRAKRRQRRAASPVVSGRVAARAAPGAAIAPAPVSGPTGHAPDPDPGIQEGIRHVDQEVDQDVGRRGDENHALDERIVPGEHGLDDQPPEPRHDEDLLRHHRAADEGAHLEPEDGDDRDEAVAHRVTEHHAPGPEPLAVGGPDVVGAEHLDHD